MNLHNVVAKDTIILSLSVDDVNVIQWQANEMKSSFEKNLDDHFSDDRIGVALYVTFTLLCKYFLHMYPIFIPMYMK